MSWTFFRCSTSSTLVSKSDGVLNTLIDKNGLMRIYNKEEVNEGGYSCMATWKQGLAVKEGKAITDIAYDQVYNLYNADYYYASIGN